MAQYVTAPKKAVIEIRQANGVIHLASSIVQMREMILRLYNLDLSIYQCTRLANYHTFKRAKFELPEGLVITRLNHTKRAERNLRKHAAEAEAHAAAEKHAAEALANKAANMSNTNDSNFETFLNVTQT